MNDAWYIFGLFDGLIEEIGKHLVVHIMIDKVSAYRVVENKLI